MGYFETMNMVKDVYDTKSKIGEFQGLINVAKEGRKFKSIKAKLDKIGQLSTENIDRNDISKTDFEWFILIMSSGYSSMTSLDGETFVEKIECDEYIIETVRKPWEKTITTVKKVK